MAKKLKTENGHVGNWEKLEEYLDDKLSEENVPAEKRNMDKKG